MSKKVLRILLALTLSAFLTSCSSAPGRSGFEGKVISNVDSYEELLVEVDAPMPEDTPFSNNADILDVSAICIAEEGADTAVSDAVNNSLLKLPRWVRSAFLQSGWTMSVVPYDIATEDYGEQFEAGSVLGSTAYRIKTVKILNHPKAAVNSPIHEMGHWLDSYCGYPTLYDDTFSDIFDREGHIYRNTFGPTCSWGIQEFFAEGFWCYWQSPSTLKKACPDFYLFLEAKLLEAEVRYEMAMEVR